MLGMFVVVFWIEKFSENRITQVGRSCHYAQLLFSNFALSHGILPGVVVLPGTVDDGIVVL